MVYIRNKKIKGIDYAYLVTSKWEADKKRSTQEIIKYLGRADHASLESIPAQYRNDPRILSFLSQYSPSERNKKEALLKNAKTSLMQALLDADVDRAIDLYKSTSGTLRVDEFFNDVLKPVMIDIGIRWAEGALSIAEEHVCTNTAMALVERIKVSPGRHVKRRKILLCVPEGELHSLPCAILESILGARGYEVANIAPSAPNGSVISYAEEMQPDLVMVSVTLLDNIGAAKRLVKGLSTKVTCPILVGGQAFSETTEIKPAIVIPSNENSLADILRIVSATN